MIAYNMAPSLLTFLIKENPFIPHMCWGTWLNALTLSKMLKSHFLYEATPTTVFNTAI